LYPKITNLGVDHKENFYILAIVVTKYMNFNEETYTWLGDFPHYKPEAELNDH
jgi:hypothetical protein